MSNGDLLLPPQAQAMPPMASSPSPSPSMSQTRQTHLTFNLSPPLIAMVAVIGTAFLIILYTHVISHLVRLFCRRRRRRLLLPGSSPHPGTGTVSFNSSSDFFFLSPYGLDETSIKNLPTSVFSKSKAKHLACTNRDCAVCLLEFEDNDSLRTLPYCSHAFHVECIDIWLRSHATCPLCRSSVTRPDFISYSPFIPMRASRIRPSLDDLLLYPPQESDPEIFELPALAETSISPQLDSLNSNRRENFFLKRSYSFGFERNLPSERMNIILEPSTASPHFRFRHNNHHHHHHRYSFWSRRFFPSPFSNNNNSNFISSSSRSSRVFSSFRRKSPLARRRANGTSSLFFPLSAGPGPSSRRTRSMTIGFNFNYSSRMRCGDPEALLSPERLVVNLNRNG